MYGGKWVALPPDKKILHSSSIYVILFYGQNNRNDHKKEQFFSPRSCGVSFCYGVSFCPGDPRGFFVGRLLAIAPFLQGAYHRGWIADHTINLCAELALHRADGLWSDVSVSSYPRPFLDGLDQS